MNEKDYTFDALLRYAACEIKRDEIKKRKKQRILYLTAAAAACLAVVFTLPINAYLRRIITVFNNNYISVNIKDENNHSDIIENGIKCGYLPDGWEYEIVGQTDFWCVADLKKGNSEIIIRKEIYSEEKTYNMDDHYGEPEEINIGGTVYYYNDNGIQQHIFFVDDYVYIISAHGVDKGDLMKIIDSSR